MTETLSIFSAPSWRSPRTANYVAALIRQGDNFDYYKWLQGDPRERGSGETSPIGIHFERTCCCGNRRLRH